jgi:hypothetical protein
MKHKRNFTATTVFKRTDMKQDDRHNPLDAKLDALFRALPDKPVPSNFTARVLQGLDRETARPASPPWWEMFRHPLQWAPRAAMTALALWLGMFSYQYHTQTERRAYERSLEAVTQVASLPSPDVLKDFNAIRHMSATPAADHDLLALMQ